MKPIPQHRYTAEEEKQVKLVTDDFRSARNARNTSCYWDDGDWITRWDLQEKMYMMWFAKPSQDEFQSNVKSPMATGRIASTLQKLRKIDLQFVARPADSEDAEDKRKAMVVQELLNVLFKKGLFKYKLITAMEDSLVHGSSFLQIYPLETYRDVKIQQTDTEEMSKKERKDLEDGKRIWKSDRIIEYDDIMIEPVKIQEMFIDPSARNLHGSSYSAQYVVRRMLPSMAQFEAMYEGDKDAKNVSKVRPGSSYKDGDYEYFQPPKDMTDGDYVELLHYYNKPKDKYIVIANDVVIKDMPLPFNHKQLPFIKLDTIPNPHQFYGIGIPDRLAALQAEEEILKNLTYDRLHITSNPLRKVKKGSYGEFSKHYLDAQGGGALLPVNNLDDEAPMEFPNMNFDMFRAVEGINRDAVLATQIDPIQMGIMQKYVSATTSMLTKEQMDTFISGLIDSFSRDLSVMGYQIVSLMKQFYTVPRIDEKLGEMPKRVRLEGIEIDPDTFEITNKDAGAYSFMEVKPEYFEISGDWDVVISPESVEVMSKALEMQKSQANIAQLAPFMVDPTNKEAMKKHPTPWINGPKTVEWYVQTNGIPEDLLVVDIEDEDIGRDRAVEQGKRMLNGEIVEGMAGEPDAHKKIHLQQLTAQNNKVKNIKQQIMDSGMPPEYMAQMPIGMAMKEAQDLAMKLALHLEADNAPIMVAEEMAVEAAKPSQPMGPQVPMPPGLTQAGGQTPPIPAAGNQMQGMQPQSPPPRAGRPPMAAQ